jgi:steroid delta-isomerase-like uncharacterized protein
MLYFTLQRMSPDIVNVASYPYNIMVELVSIECLGGHMQVKEYTIPQLIDNVRTGKMSDSQLVQTLTAMGISASGARIIADASQTTPVTPIPRLDVQEDEALQLQLHNRHLEVRNAHDVSALQNDYAEDAVVEGTMFREPFVGRAAIAARIEAERVAFPDLRVQMTNRVVHGNQVTVEWVATGTHTGDFPGFPASGRSFSIPGVTVVIRERGKIVRESLYYDMEVVRHEFGQ